MTHHPRTECHEDPSRAGLPSCLQPVVLAVPPHRWELNGREKVAYLSRHARRALGISAARAGLTLQHLLKDANGAPLPDRGVFWSVTHKPRWVAGVAARFPVGIDVERIRPCSDRLMDKVADRDEWVIGGGRSEVLFFRYWTAKEAVLKATGAGIAGLTRCRIRQVDSATRLTVDFMGRSWGVGQMVLDHHMAAVTPADGDIPWVVTDGFSP